MAYDFSTSSSTKMLKNIASKSSEETSKKTVRNINVDLIDFNEDNNKIFSVDNLESLKLAIERSGFKGAIEVFKKGDRYEIISGHRRFLANKMAGNKTIPCEIKAEPNDIEKADLLVISNITSRQLSPLEKGRAIVYYKENVLVKSNFKGNVREELAKRFGYPQSSIQRFEALTKLIEPLQKLVEKEQVPYSRICSAFSLSEDEQYQLYEMIVDNIADSPDGEISAMRVTGLINSFKEPKEETTNKTDIKSVETLNQDVRKIIEEMEEDNEQMFNAEIDDDITGDDFYSSEEYDESDDETETEYKSTEDIGLPQKSLYSEPDYDSVIIQSAERVSKLLSDSNRFQDKNKVAQELEILKENIDLFLSQIK